MSGLRKTCCSESKARPASSDCRKYQCRPPRQRLQTEQVYIPESNLDDLAESCKTSVSFQRQRQRIQFHLLTIIIFNFLCRLKTFRKSVFEIEITAQAISLDLLLRLPARDEMQQVHALVRAAFLWKNHISQYLNSQVTSNILWYLYTFHMPARSNGTQKAACRWPDPTSLSISYLTKKRWSEKEFKILIVLSGVVLTKVDFLHTTQATRASVASSYSSYTGTTHGNSPTSGSRSRRATPSQSTRSAVQLSQ